MAGARVAAGEMEQSMIGLTVLGGSPAIGRRIEERWAPPIERQKALLGEMLERGEVTGAGGGIGKRFEASFAEYVGCRFALSFSHGTAALAAAYYAAGVGPGDEVITPALGYIGSYAAAMHMGARPVFCDVAPESLLIDPDRIRPLITRRTRAVNVVHLNGRVCDLGRIGEICKDHALFLVDDASHAAGAEWDGRRVGNAGHVTCFSLQGADPMGKPVAAGEGGMACTNDETSYQRMLAYCHLHRDNLATELAGGPLAFLDKEALGLKWRPHPLGMGLGLLSLESLEERTKKRRAHYSKLVASLGRCSFLRPLTPHPSSRWGGFYNGIKVVYDPDQLGGAPLSTLSRALVAEGVPVSTQSAGHLEYRRRLFSHGFDLWGRGRGPIGAAWHGLDAFEAPSPAAFPVAESTREKILTFPSFIDVDEALYDGLAEALLKISRGRDELRQL